MGTITLDVLNTFPTAKGYGKNTTGGHSGSVYYVTNLNATGTGSLYQGLVVESGSRTVVFDVAGTITGSGDGVSWVIVNDNLTVDAATAPGEGIELQKINIQVDANNVFLRNLRIRTGFGGGWGGETDALTIQSWSGNVSDVYVDRCSFAYSPDENIGLDGTRGSNAGVTNITIGRSIFGHGVYGSLMNDYVTNTSWSENFFVLNGSRNYPYTAKNHCRYEVINNLTFDTFWSQATLGYGSDVDWIGSYLKTNTNRNPSGGYQFELNDDCPACSASVSNSDVYGNDNFSNYTFSTGDYDVDWSNRDTGTRVMTGNITTPYSASLVPTNVLSSSGVGATPWNRDSIDEALITSFNNGSGSRLGSSVTAGDSNFANPVSSSHDAGYDTNNNGIPDTFEATHSITSNNQIITNWDFGTYDVVNNAGHTALEMYLFYLNNDFDNLPQSNPLPPAVDYHRPFRKIKLGNQSSGVYYIGSNKQRSD